MAYLVQCNQCDARTTVQGASDPDGALSCACCPEDHHHGQAAAACPQTHPGPCALGVDGCTVCRPLTIVALPDTVQLVAETLRKG